MNKVIAHHSESNRIYYTSTILALLIWSTSFIATKAAYTTFPPLTLGLSRFIIASIVLGIVLLIKKEQVKVKPKDLATISFSGVLGITLYFSMENIGVSLTTASNAAM
ncbi:DMT family transporter [Paenibacillus polymyxa]|uniref:DMT family transporter n=1 Tax=Paenibacillus polymyxa TaxID=1406 RepID=UPI002ED674DF|nr:DMT family transporter [Paenibacillus polymyxa]